MLQEKSGEEYFLHSQRYRDRERVNEEDLFSHFITKLDISKFRKLFAHDKDLRS